MLSSTCLPLKSWIRRSPYYSILLLSSVLDRAFIVPSIRGVQTKMSSTNTLRHVDNAPSWMLPERTRVLNCNENKSGKCVVYWMQRDVRTVDNWALLYAAYLAQESNVPLRVMYSLPPPSSERGEMRPFYERLTERYGSFLLGGLEHVHKELSEKNVPFHMIMPHSPSEVGSTVFDALAGWQAHTIVCDHSPLKPYRSWLEDQLVPLCTSSISVVHVDTHNVVPVWYASPKREIGARTLRPKLNKLLDRFLTEFPDLGGNKHLTTSINLPSFDKDRYIQYLKWDATVKAVEWAQPGTERAMQQFELFSSVGLRQFHDLRNNPNYRQVCSNLSPWINHGHVSFQRLALQIKPLHKKYANGTAMYIEEGLVRRELSDNFVYYTPETYDSLDSALMWAQETLEVHCSDVRDWLFSTKELEEARSHDDLWNAAQLQLVQEGKLHGFLRMYWAKKILEWTESPSLALQTAQHFNDKYAIDGCDPNGFVGVGWSIMGIHDQGWKEREIFGKIRYMNYAGCKRKFDVDAFVRMYPPAAKNAIAAASKYGKEVETGKSAPRARKPTVPAKETPATRTKPKVGSKRKDPS